MDFNQLAILLVVAGVFGVVAKILRQPLLIGYLFAGITLAVSGIITDTESLTSLGQIGVALLLFLVGLEMNLQEIPTIGKVALYTGIGQIVFTSIIGFFLALLLGFGTLPAIYIAVALTFSSTIIMVKLLSEKKDLGSLYGKISIGFLLVQDFVAMIILMFLAGLGQGGLSIGEYGLIAIKAIVLFASIWVLSKKVLPRFFEKYVANSTELLFVVSIAWALGISALVAGPLGFTLEIGGFLAGLALSNLPEHLQIVSRTKPLRDFFLTIFFLLLGTKLAVGGLGAILFPGIVFSLFVLIGNPIIVLIIMGFLGYKKRTSFKAGLTVAQISEFSFVLMAMGASLGHLGSTEVAVVVLTGVVTMTISTYMIMESDKIFHFLKKPLSLFEKRRTKEQPLLGKTDMRDHVVLIGCDKTGSALLPFLKRASINLLVVDYNPRLFNRLTADKIPVLFGDINDTDVLHAAALGNAKLIISTVANLKVNLVLLSDLKSMKAKAKTVFTSLSKSEATTLYEKGADYVVVPDSIAGEHMRHVFVTYGLSSEKLSKLGKNHFKRLLK